MLPKATRTSPATISTLLATHKNRAASSIIEETFNDQNKKESQSTQSSSAYPSASKTTTTSDVPDLNLNLSNNNAKKEVTTTSNQTTVSAASSSSISSMVSSTKERVKTLFLRRNGRRRKQQLSNHDDDDEEEDYCNDNNNDDDDDDIPMKTHAEEECDAMSSGETTTFLASSSSSSSSSSCEAMEKSLDQEYLSDHEEEECSPNEIIRSEKQVNGTIIVTHHYTSKESFDVVESNDYDKETKQDSQEEIENDTSNVSDNKNDDGDDDDDDEAIQESIECVYRTTTYQEQTQHDSYLSSPQNLCRNSTESTQPLQTDPSSASFQSSSNNNNNPTQAYKCPYCQFSSGKYASTASAAVPPPPIPPKSWPQNHLLLRPTPGTGTKVTGVRFVGTNHYLWKSSCCDDDDDDDSNKEGNEKSSSPWWEELSQFWDASSSSSKTGKEPITNHNNNKKEEDDCPMTKCCPECTILPINNGNEPTNQTLVVDFTSEYFEGTLMLRIRNSVGTTEKTASYYDDSHDDDDDNIQNNKNTNSAGGYFEGLNRRYQAVIHGKFKSTKDDDDGDVDSNDAVPMMQCVTGLTLQRPVGKLPPSWLLRGAEKIMKIFAPKLQIRAGGKYPGFISPLGSTPQVICAQKDQEEEDDDEQHNDGHLERGIEESPHPHNSFLATLPPLYQPSDAPTSTLRAKARKKAFDKLLTSSSSTKKKQQHFTSNAAVAAASSDKNKTMTFDENTTYTFEFLQHLIDFDDLSLDLGSLIGKVKLKEMLDGQPIKIMAAIQRNGHSSSSSSAVSKQEQQKRKRGENTGVEVEETFDHLWSFDVWHECLYDDAVRHYEKMNNNTSVEEGK